MWHLSSLDAPTVAVVWALAFAWAARVRLPFWLVTVLALTTWAIYIADRLLDARKAVRLDRLDTLRDRHFFHWRHRRWFVPVCVLAALGAAALVASRMVHSSLPAGTVLAVAAFGYFASVHVSSGTNMRSPRLRTAAPTLSPILSKELFVGVLFTAGCLLPAWMRSCQRPWWLALAAAFFAALAWLNCHAIEQWESQPGGPGVRPRAGIARRASLIAVAGLVLALALPANSPSSGRIASLLVSGAVSSLLLALLDRLSHRIAPLTLRAAADLVLIAPLALLTPLALLPQ